MYRAFLTASLFLLPPASSFMPEINGPLAPIEVHDVLKNIRGGIGAALPHSFFL